MGRWPERLICCAGIFDSAHNRIRHQFPRTVMYGMLAQGAAIVNPLAVRRPPRAGGDGLTLGVGRV
jgi:hypothetical protein